MENETIHFHIENSMTKNNIDDRRKEKRSSVRNKKKLSVQYESQFVGRTIDNISIEEVNLQEKLKSF